MKKNITKIDKKKWILCKAGKHWVRRPLTNYRENGQLWHVPSFSELFCSRCDNENGVTALKAT